ncbi:tannase/feruloyl esterase family alpha/beta hydrolase [Streptomyces tendae]|uniref:tannase/feruloyl esterase family alpha/beta hydrolase n=1 Tax=Streptomyces tendae TaxID=1932 RepID=UPI0036C605FC
MNKRIHMPAVALPTAPGLGLLQGISHAAADSPADGTRTTMPASVTRHASVGHPEPCQIRGKVNSFDTAASDINFQLNLPTSWNGKSVQFGGAGFNGVVVSGLARGYVTFGNDGGVAVGTARTGSFALNEEAFANYARET